MRVMVSQIIGVSSVCSSVCSGTNQRKHQSSASLAFVRGIHRWPVVSPHKGAVTRKSFHLMTSSCYYQICWNFQASRSGFIIVQSVSHTLLAKKVVTPPLKTIKPMWIELLCFHLAEIRMIWTRDCSPTKSDTTLGRHSMQGQVGSSSSETTV